MDLQTSLFLCGEDERQHGSVERAALRTMVLAVTSQYPADGGG